MSERVTNNETTPASPESYKSNEAEEALRAHVEKLSEAAKEAERKNNETDRNRLEQEAKKHAVELGNEDSSSEQDEKQTIVGLHQSMKENSYKEELAKIQNNLKGTSKAFSKFIHNKSIEQISEVGAKTIARPSGLLGGSIVTFFGSLVVFWMAKYNGFSYNFSVMIILFVGGFLLGSILELTMWTFRRSKPSK
jgi:hypothetical protein